tara:strand:+ start:5028 stop:6341 length:1314 start_codon:yes stop_codon:yes gene_type:complete
MALDDITVGDPSMGDENDLSFLQEDAFADGDKDDGKEDDTSEGDKDDESDEGDDDSKGDKDDKSLDDNEDTDEDKKDKKDEDEDSELDDDELKADEVAEAQGRPTFRELKKGFPELFKKHPQLKTVIFREEAYTAVFPTVDDAKDADRRLNALEEDIGDIFNGNPEGLIKALQERSPDKAIEFSKKFMAVLEAEDEGLYYQVASPLFLGLISQLDSIGRRDNNKNLTNAAKLINQFIYGSTALGDTGDRLSSSTRKDPKLDKERQELEEKKDQYDRRIHQENHRQITDAYYSNISRMISSKIKRAMPDATPFVRKAMLNSVIGDIGETMEADGRHMGTMRSLWQRGQKDGFSRDSKTKILRALLERSRSLTNRSISKIVAEAVKGEKNKTKLDDETGSKDDVDKKVIKSTRRREARKARSSTGGPPSDMSDLDFLRS